MLSLKTIAALGAALLLLAGCGSGNGSGNGAGNGTGTASSGGTAHQPHKPGPEQKVLLVWQQNDWMVQLNGGPATKPADAHTKLDKNVGPTKFVVDIAGNTSATFDDSSLSVWEGDNAKSQPQSGINSTQVLPPIITKNGKQLIFYDLNQDAAVTLNYQLGFKNGVKPVDPIIDNGGSD